MHDKALIDSIASHHDILMQNKFHDGTKHWFLISFTGNGWKFCIKVLWHFQELSWSFFWVSILVNVSRGRFLKLVS